MADHSHKIMSYGLALHKNNLNNTDNPYITLICAVYIRNIHKSSPKIDTSPKNDSPL